jgi:hypothetical protein
MRKKKRLLRFAILTLVGLAGISGFGYLAIHYAAPTLTQNSTEDVTQKAADVVEQAITAPPVVTWVEKPGIAAQNRLKMIFRVEASSPLQNIEVHVLPIVKSPGVMIDKDVITVPSFFTGRKTLEWNGQVDVTHSLLAGNPVTLQIVAHDEKNQSGGSDLIAMTLPEHSFTNPVARAIYTVRKRLQEDPENRRMDTLRILAGLLQQRDAFKNHELTLLTLRSAAVRIALDKSDEGLRSSLNLLWHAAVLFEEDPVRVAQKNANAAGNP